MASKTIVDHSLDDYFQTTPIGSVEKAISNNLYGINHRQIKGLVSSNKDVYGYTFFVRPQLNLQTENVRNERRFYSLLSKLDTSIQRFVRTTLDPRLMTGYKFADNSIPAISCPLVDINQAFIPILSNSLISISGWPDIIAPTHTSKPGLYNEVYSQVDGLSRYYETFDLTASFRNSRGDPILYLFYIWLHYSSLVFEGYLVPYIDFITENEIDYMSRIYRLVLDKEKRIVTKIAATGVAFPISVPTGSFFDYNEDKPYNDQNNEISIRFKCLGVNYQDDILIREFNATSIIHNLAMKDGIRESAMVKISQINLGLFNNRGYPRINPDSYELEWWVEKNYYINRTNSLINNGLVTDNTESVEEFGAF